MTREKADEDAADRVSVESGARDPLQLSRRTATLALLAFAMLSGAVARSDLMVQAARARAHDSEDSHDDDRQRS